METLELKRVLRDVEETEFDCGIDTINDMVKNSYYPFIAQHAYTYSIIYKEKIIGYIQIMLRDINISSFPDDISDINPEIRDGTITSMHINFLAIDQRCQRKTFGTYALKMMISRVDKFAKEWPIRVITIDAREELVTWYERIGFKRISKNFDGQSGYNVAMYMSCLKYGDELEEYLKSQYE